MYVILRDPEVSVKSIKHFLAYGRIKFRSFGVNLNLF